MKFWLKELYLNAAEEHRVAAQNEHIWALGSEGEAAQMHHSNALENYAFAELLTDMANNIEEAD